MRRRWPRRSTLRPSPCGSSTAWSRPQSGSPTRRLAEKLGGDHLVAAIAHTRGVMMLSQGRAVDARSHFDVCGSLLTDLEAPDGGFFPANSIGFPVEWDDGSPRLVFEETLVSGHRLDAGPAAAYLRFSQAWAARAAGDLDAALAHATDSVESFAATGWDYGVALADNLLGNLLRLAGDIPAAHRHLDRSLQLRARLGDRRATGVTLGALGLLAAAEDDDTAAQRYLWRALELFERIEDGFGVAGTLLNLGVVSLRAGDLDLATARLPRCKAGPAQPRISPPPASAVRSLDTLRTAMSAGRLSAPECLRADADLRRKDRGPRLTALEPRRLLACLCSALTAWQHGGPRNVSEMSFLTDDATTTDAEVSAGGEGDRLLQPTARHRAYGRPRGGTCFRM